MEYKFIKSILASLVGGLVLMVISTAFSGDFELPQKLSMESIGEVSQILVIAILLFGIILSSSVIVKAYKKKPHQKVYEKVVKKNTIRIETTTRAIDRLELILKDDRGRLTDNMKEEVRRKIAILEVRKKRFLDEIIQLKKDLSDD